MIIVVITIVLVVAITPLLINFAKQLGSGGE